MASSQGKSDDMGVVWLVLLLIPVAFFWMCWYRWHAQISYWGLKWTWYQLAVFDWPFMPDVIREWRANAAMFASAPARVTFKQLIGVLNTAGYFFVPLPLLLAVRGFVLANRHKANLTRRKITVQTLPWIMSKHSPAIIPSLYYGDPDTLLLNVDPPEHRSSVNPEEWVQENGLLVNGALDHARCRELLIRDLGARIASLDELKPHEKALFAVFGARLFSSGEELERAQTLLDALNRSCHTHTYQGNKGYPDLTLADAAFQKYSKHPEVGEWLGRYSYSRTLLHAMHRKAVQNGKLPSSHFRWLKGMDRELFYALNTTGRKAPFQESSAVFTMTLWEDYAADSGYRLVEPFVDDAITGIEKYLIKIGLMAPTATE